MADSSNLLFREYLAPRETAIKNLFSSLLCISVKTWVSGILRHKHQSCVSHLIENKDNSTAVHVIHLVKDSTLFTKRSDTVAEIGQTKQYIFYHYAALEFLLNFFPFSFCHSPYHYHRIRHWSCLIIVIIYWHWWNKLNHWSNTFQNFPRLISRMLSNEVVNYAISSCLRVSHELRNESCL